MEAEVEPDGAGDEANGKAKEAAGGAIRISSVDDLKAGLRAIADLDRLYSEIQDVMGRPRQDQPKGETMEQPNPELTQESPTSSQLSWLLIGGLTLGLGIPQSLLVYLFYNWFVKPLGFPSLGYWQIVGLLTFGSVVTFKCVTKVEKSKLDFSTWDRVPRHNYVMLALYLLFGWTVHIIMKGHL